MLKYLLLLALVPLLLIPTFGQEYSDNVSTSLISVQTDNSHYDEGDTIVISGNVGIVIGETPVLIQIIHEGAIIEIAHITVAQDGSFTKTVLAEKPVWKNEGEYIIKASYQDQVVETEFSFTPKSESIETTYIFEVDAGSYGTFDGKCIIKGGTVRDMIIDTDIFAIIVQIESPVEGTITLDLPREFIGAKQYYDKDDTFIILIDGIEVPYQEVTNDEDFRRITINFEEGDSDIEIIGTYVVGEFVTYTLVNNFLTITTNKPSYLQGETIIITGQIPNVYNDQLNISLTSPTHGLLDTMYNVTINNNSYSASITTDNNIIIHTAGSYTLTANYGTNTASTIFHYAYPIQEEDDYFIPDSSYLTLSDHEIDKWNRELTKWQNAQNRTDSKIEFYYEKLDTAIIRNQTDKITLYTERIGHSMALSELYDGLIECLQEQIDLYS